jgi:hypothetical protein
MNIGYDNKIISSTSNIKFVGIVIDDPLTWQAHTEMIETKLSAACHAVRAIKPFVSCDILKIPIFLIFTPL